MNIGGNAPTPASNTCLDGYLAEFHWVQGTALGPESFGEFGELAKHSEWCSRMRLPFTAKRGK